MTIIAGEQSTGWDALRVASPGCLLTGRWAYDLRLDEKSRMSREVHVRFCEGAGVRFPRATRLVACFQYKRDAENFGRLLMWRMKKFSLELVPEKTQLLLFGRFARERKAEYGEKPGTFVFLGFRHVCGTDRRGKFGLTTCP